MFLKRYAAIAALMLSATAFADVKISDLPDGAALGGTEPIPAVQAATTVKTTPDAIATYVKGGAQMTVPNGGTGLATVAADNVLMGNGTATMLQIGVPNCTVGALQYNSTSNVFTCATASVAGGGTGLATLAADSIAMGNGTSAMIATAVPNCTTATSALRYDTTANTFNCNATLADASNVSATTAVMMGCTVNQNQNMALARAGNIVTMRFTGNVGPCTSNANTFGSNAAPLPAIYRPAIDVTIIGVSITDNSVAAPGCLRVTTAGDVGYGVYSNTNGTCNVSGFTATGSKAATNSASQSTYTWQVN